MKTTWYPIGMLSLLAIEWFQPDMSNRFFACAGVVLLVIATAPAPVAVPATGIVAAGADRIAGRVIDAIGEPLPAVSVTIIAEAGGLARHATTGRDGTYRFDRLSRGTYRVDFDLQGFDLVRRNHVAVDDQPVTVEAVLRVSTVCECIEFAESRPLVQRAGQVIDEDGKPLPHARVEIVSPMRREVRYTDADGRFLVRVPVDERWPLTAADTGFRPVTQPISGSLGEPFVLKLSRAGATGVPANEVFDRGCRCAADLFTHNGR